MIKYLMVGLGGFLGSAARFWVGGYIVDRAGIRFPYGTFVVNISGCFLIGLAMTVLELSTHANPNWRYLVPVGFIGGYTTFSTFELETFRTVQDGEILSAFLYVVSSVAIGFLSVWCGVIAGRAIG